MISKNLLVRGLFISTAMTLAMSAAQAADAVVVPPASAIEAVPEALSPWQIRVRALGVITDDKGYVDQVPGSGLNVSDSITPELDITYYFTENFAAELILGTTRANIKGSGTLDGLDIGRVWVLPPTITAQYHFTNFGAFKPYVGAGVNYTVFYSQRANDIDDLKVKNTFGGALQVGFDYMFDEHWGINFDVKKLFLEPKFDAVVGGTPVTGKAKLNPWLIGTGITYRF